MNCPACQQPLYSASDIVPDIDTAKATGRRYNKRTVRCMNESCEHHEDGKFVECYVVYGEKKQ